MVRAGSCGHSDYTRELGIVSDSVSGALANNGLLARNLLT